MPPKKPTAYKQKFNTIRYRISLNLNDDQQLDTSTLVNQLSKYMHEFGLPYMNASDGWLMYKSEEKMWSNYWPTTRFPGVEPVKAIFYTDPAKPANTSPYLLVRRWSVPLENGIATSRQVRNDKTGRYYKVPPSGTSKEGLIVYEAIVGEAWENHRAKTKYDLQNDWTEDGIPEYGVIAPFHGYTTAMGPKHCNFRREAARIFGNLYTFQLERVNHPVTQEKCTIVWLECVHEVHNRRGNMEMASKMQVFKALQYWASTFRKPGELWPMHLAFKLFLNGSPPVSNLLMDPSKLRASLQAVPDPTSSQLVAFIKANPLHGKVAASTPPALTPDATDVKLHLPQTIDMNSLNVSIDTKARQMSNDISAQNINNVKTSFSDHANAIISSPLSLQLVIDKSTSQETSADSNSADLQKIAASLADDKPKDDKADSCQSIQGDLHREYRRNLAALDKMLQDTNYPLTRILHSELSEITFDAQWVVSTLKEAFHDNY